jgi:sterol desaturase/sphingolipid hydroxylase (fatty acid hydroxylase superfamily)
MHDEILARLRAISEWLGLPDWPWLGALAGQILKFVDRSVFSPDGRYYWLTFFEALGVLAIAYLLRPDWRARWGGGFFRFCFPRGFFRHQSTMTDIKLNVANFFVLPFINIGWRFTGAVFIASVVGWMTRVFGPAPHLLEWTPATAIAATLLLAVLSDFGYWVWHYLAHNIPFLWSFHKVHHSAEILTPLVAGRVHPVEAILLPIFRTVATSLGMAPAIYFFVGSLPLTTIFGMELLGGLFAIAGDQLFHAHVPISWGRRLNRIFVSPATHQIHHSMERRHWDKNMGAFLAVWDWMFGTLYLPDSRQELRYGVRVGAPQPHPGLVSAYVRPFVEIAGGLTRPIVLVRRTPRYVDGLAEAGQTPDYAATVAKPLS